MIAFGQSTIVLDDDKLFQTGQLKVEGNLAKAAELRYLIHKN